MIDRRTRFTLAAGLTLLVLSRAEAGKLPDWAAAIAASVSPAPTGVPDHPARMILSETRVAVEPDGKLRVRRRLAQQALSATATEIGTGWFHFDEDAKVKIARAWHVLPGEKAEKSWGPSLDVTLNDSFLTDVRTRFVHVDGVKKGSLVFFEFEVLDTPPELAFWTLFHEDVPVELMRLEVETPPGWSVRHVWLRAQGAEPLVSGNVRVWELHSLPASLEEPLGEPPHHRAPLLMVGLRPPDGHAVGPAVLPDWAAFGTWYEKLAQGRDAVTPDVAAAAAALPRTDGDFTARMRTAAGWVRDQVRYVAKEVGVGGYRPRPAAQVVQELYGDCKDKSTLLRSVLAHGGDVAYPILVHATTPDTVAEELPSLTSFNHMVIGVSWPADVPIPPLIAPATFDAGDLGRLLLVDTTDEHLSIGAMPAALHGRKALVLASSRSRLVNLPAGDPAAHRIERHCQAELLPDGGAALTLSTAAYGEPASRARAEYRKSARDRRASVESRVRQAWTAAVIEDYSVEPESEQGAFVERCSIRLAPGSSSSSADLFALFADVLADLPRVSLSKRKSPVRYPHPLTLRHETVLKHAPLRWASAEPQQESGEGWSLSSDFERQDDTLRGQFELKLSRVRFEPTEFEELKRFWSLASRVASPAVPLGER